MDKIGSISLDRGVFTVSIDFELIWGTLDLFGPGKFRRACEFERNVVIDRLLDLFVEFKIPATWCVLGHLMLDRCEPDAGRKHPDLVRPSHPWVKGDWFDNDPGGDEESAELFFGRGLIEKIRDCPVPQEIGCHSFSHIIFGDRGCSRDAAESDIASCVAAARALDIEMRSFAFPRNAVGHLDVLGEHGFICYRGVEPRWYERTRGRALKRLGHLWDVIRAAEPPVVLPEREENGLWNVPGSMIYFPMHGLRRFIPVSQRVKRAVKGLNAAAEQRRLFHLWFHPTNLADQPDAMFDGLSRILAYADTLRAEGKLAVLPMGAVISADSHLATL